MKNFMNYDFDVQKILLATYVKAGEGALLHKNRPSHGLVLYQSGTAAYDFGKGKPLMVKAGDLIYLPKGADYAVAPLSQGSYYAINFDISEQTVFEPFVFRTKNGIDLLAAFRAAEKAWKGKKQGYVMKCKEQLYHILYQMQKEYHSALFHQS